MDYRVVKAFKNARVNEIFKQEDDMFTMERNKDNYRYSCSLDSNTIKRLASDGYLEEVTPKENKLDSILKFIEEMTEKYQDDFDAVQEAYNNQELPQCVKVEAETVYYNMTKVLNKIKQLIEE